MNILTLVYFTLYPKKAVEYATKLAEQPTLTNVKKINYLNEFFFKYLTWGKSNVETLSIAESIDSMKRSDNNIINSLIELRRIRMNIKKVTDFEKYSNEPTKKVGVSKGVASGKIMYIKDENQVVPNNSICVFPDASTRYSNQYIKCKGIIFLKGGITSHGAIVAREYKIPAIIHPNLNINNENNVTIDGSVGNIDVNYVS